MNEYTQSSWSLSDLFPSHDSPEMQAAFAELEERTTSFEALRLTLSANITTADFLMALHQIEALYALLWRVHGFASLQFSANTQDQVAQTFQAQMMQRVATIENRILFFSLWWKNLDKTTAERLAEAAGDLRYWLEAMRLFKPFTLSEPEEKIINIKDTTGVRALVNLYTTITNRYTFTLTVDGGLKELTFGELQSFIRHHDPELRAAAYQELYRVYRNDAPILGQIYQFIARDWYNECVDLRGYAGPIAARNLSNDIPEAVVDTLLEVCQRNAWVFQRFFRLKARLLGVPRLRRYDIYAPVARSDKRFAFSEAADMVFDSFRRFEPRLESLARRVFDQQHLDSEVRKGKRSGAFCSTLGPDLTPWVLVNYQGRANDVATLAHELGHAIHSMLAENHSLLTQHASLPLAENASTFAELLLLDDLLLKESDENVRRELLFRDVDDSYATIMRQAYFALFERQAHELVHKGAAVDDISAIYLENLGAQFGEAVELNDEFRNEWLTVPHFFRTPFYVYAYAFGKLVVLSLYQQYKAEGDAFKPHYLRILEAGGSQSPIQILSAAGIDAYSDKFWQGGFDVIARRVAQLESLA